jgi:hypothetical protein
MGRPRKVVTEGGTAEPTTPVVRRRRSSNTFDHGAQTAMLVDALLKTRAGRGATQEELQAVVAWARGVHAETEALSGLASRPRRLKAQAPIERIAAHDVNKTLLEGTLAGGIHLDVDENGSIVFIIAD